MTLVQYKLQSAFSVCEVALATMFWRLVGCPFKESSFLCIVTRTAEVGGVHNSTTFYP
jgi:hypothetical protein